MVHRSRFSLLYFAPLISVFVAPLSGWSPLGIVLASVGPLLVMMFVLLWCSTTYQLEGDGIRTSANPSTGMSLIRYSDIQRIEKRDGPALEPVS